MSNFSAPSKQVRVLGLVCLFALALAVSVPFILRSFPMGDDSAFHMCNWNEVLKHWKEGVLFPSWNAEQAFGLGEPTFVFYPPASLYLGALLTWIFGVAATPAVFSGICVLIAGATMHSFASEHLKAEQSWIAALLFAVNPYLLLDLWIRGAMAEALALSLFPLLLGAVTNTRDLRGSIILGLAYAAVIFCNIPAIVIAGYTILMILLVRIFAEGSVRPLIYGLLGAALGTAFSAVVILPALLAQKHVHISNAFLINWTDFFWPDRLKIFLPALIFFAAIVGTQVFGRIYSKHPRLFAVFIVANASVFFITTLSSPLYRYLPDLSTIQFSFRWTMVAACTASVMFAASRQVNSIVMKVGFVRTTIVLSATLVIAVTLVSARLNRSITEGKRFTWEGKKCHSEAAASIQEYLPKQLPETSTSDSSLARVSAELAPMLVNECRSLTIEKWASEDRRISVYAPEKFVLKLPILFYPDWAATLDGSSVILGSDAQNGVIQLDVPAGRHRVELRFRQSPYRFYGLLVSILSLAGSLVYVVVSALRAENGRADAFSTGAVSIAASYGGSR